jgi:hypothetical protein
MFQGLWKSIEGMVMERMEVMRGCGEFGYQLQGEQFNGLQDKKQIRFDHNINI